MEMRKIKLPTGYYDVVSMKEYVNNPDRDVKKTAIMVNDYALPILSPNDDKSVGIKMGSMVCPINPPQTEEEKETYSLSNMIDLEKAKDYSEVIAMTQKMKDNERDILLTVDNKTCPIIGPDDTAQMRALKEAITLKECDIDSYSHRFGSNYANEKRILRDNDISLKKLVKYGESLDMKMTLTIEDSNPDVPNPIGKTIQVELTRNGGGEE